MVLKSNAFETGLTSGTTINPGNSGYSGGDAFDAVGAGWTFSNVTPMHGSLCARMTSPGSASGTFRMGITGAPSTISYRYYYRVSALPSADHWMTQVTKTTNTSTHALLFQGTNLIRFNTNSVTRWTSSNGALSINTWYRFEVYLNAGSSNSTGQYRVAYYLGDSATTPGAGTTTDSGLITGQDICGAGPYTFDNLYVGKVSGNTFPTGTIDVDSIKFATGADVPAAPYLLGPVSVANPVVTPGATQYGDPGTFTLSATGTISGDTITSATWAFQSSNNGHTPTVGSTSNTGTGTATVSASTASVTLQTGTYVFRNTMTGAGTGSGSGDTTIYVTNVANARVEVAAEIDDSDWTTVGSGATRLARLADSDDATGLESEAAPVNSNKRLRFHPLRPGDLQFNFRGYQTPATPAITGDFNLYKEDGTTLVCTKPITVPTAVGAITVNCDETTDLSSITGVNDAATLVLRRALVGEIVVDQA